ncbi:MAG TPA: ankyrin repeat domain-containing protein [Pyrinomonadaceae bacterium]|nr:ankyrin repeat domain-containing protein [Pyrinomonadaceae bacterium]
MKETVTRLFLIISFLSVLTLFAGCRNIQKLSSAKLRLAACEGKIDEVRSFIALGANVNEKSSSSGSTALIGAEACDPLNAEAIVKILLESGAEVNTQDKYGETALMYAARNGHAESIKALIAKGAWVNVRNNEGETAIVKAVQNGCDVHALKVLIEAGANVNALTDKGESVLEKAEASLACPESGMIQVLKDSGAKYDKRNIPTHTNRRTHP